MPKLVMGMILKMERWYLAGIIFQAELGGLKKIVKNVHQ